MKSSVEKKIITTLLGLALLMVWSTVTQANSTSLLVFFGSSFGVLIFLLVYDFLSHKISKHQVVEANFQDLYNNAPCGYHSVDADGTFIAINDTELRWLGYSRDEVIGKLKITDLLPPKYAASVQEIFPRFLEQGWVKDLEIQMIRKDGTMLPVLLNATAIRDVTGNFVATRATIFDITDRKQAEEALRKSEERFRLAVDNIPDTFVIYDEQRRFQFVNAEALRRTGLSAEALIGHTDEEIHPPEITQAYLPTLEWAMKTRTIQRTECTLTLPTTGKFTVFITYVPLLDEQGEIYSVLGITHDLTQRKQAEAKLQQSEQKFRQLAENINEVFWLSNVATHEILYVSPAYEQIWGRSCESLYAKPQLFLESVYPDDRQQLSSILEQGFAGEIEYRVVRPDGSMRWVRDRGFPIRNESGEVYRLAGIAQDITQQKEAEAMLRQVNEELEIRVAQRTAELQEANDCLQRELFERERVELALRQSEERWQLAMRGSNDGIWDLDIKNNHCFHSARWAKMLGYEEHEVSNPQDRWETRVHPDDIKRVIQARQDHLERKTPHYSAEYRMQCKDGSYKWILSRAQAVWDEAQNPLRMVGFHTDISDRKRAEEARRESEERWQLALRGSNDGIWDWNVKTNEVFFSSRWKQMRGFEEHEIRNHLDEWSKRIHPEDLERVIQTVQDHFAKKTPFCIAEYRVLRKDNTYMWICDRGQALWDEEGNVVRMAGSETDITERKQTEETLRQQACIFENLYDAIILTDLEGCIIDWNPAAERVFGYSKAEVLGKTPAIVHRVENSAVLTREILAQLQKVRRWAGEINFVRKDGTEGVCETVVVPLYNEQGEAIATIGVNKDITDRKQAEETLRQQACIFENLHDGIILTDLDGRIIDWNPRAEKMFGYAKAEVLGKTPKILQKPEESDELTHKIIDEMLNTGRWAGELNFICKEETESVCETCKVSTKSICETVVVPLRNEQGCAIATIWVNRDISDRKLTEAALRRAYDELEMRVQKRTLDLAKANEELQIENAERRRVEAELKIRAQQQAAVAELGQQALAGNQLSHLMDQAVALITQILKVEYCKVLELLPDGNSLLLQAGVGWKEGLVGQAILSVGLDSQAGYTLLSSEPIIVEDLRAEQQFSSPCLLHQHGVVSGLSVIIPGPNRPYGVLGAHTSRKRQFTKDDVHFLQATANVLATAINRKQAEAELRRAHNDLEVRVQERTLDLAKANLELQQKIIERKQVEEERAKLVAILEATPDIVWTASIDGRTLYLNSAARKIFGFGENENSTHFTISNAHPKWAYEIILNEAIPSAIRDGMWVGETAFLSHDGREIPVNQLLLAHKSSDGSINMLSTVARDMRHQKQIAATLVESERRWRSLLENVRLVVVGLDKDGKVDYVNPYFLELVGYTIAEVVGQNWFETFLPHHQKQRVQNNFIDLLEQEFYTHNQSVILTKDGEERVMAWNNTLLKDLQGNVIGTLSIGEDITERQGIERMKDEFISVVSHELRTPLTSIHGALNLLSSGLVSTQSDKGRRVIEIAAESAERLVRLVNDILELERLESGKISLIKQTCNTAELINQAIDMMQVMANRAGITLCVSLASIDLHADPDRIIQVLTNLLGNAIKFSPKDSTVWLTVERGIGNGEEGDLPHPPILFQVRDQGRGIPAEKVESIFERFHQVDASDSRKKGGTGLGLAICRSIVQQHGGRIWVESVLGEGSSFYFTLPMAMKDSNYDNQANLGN